VRSAVANAEHNHQVRNLDDLRIVHAAADGGPSMKRVQPRAMGRAFFIRHKMSHLTIGVSDETNGAPAMTPAAPPARRPATPAPGKAPARAETPPKRGRRPAGKRTEKAATKKPKEKK